MHRREVEILAPVVNRGSAENHLGNMFRAYELRDAIGHAATLQANDFRAQTLGES